METNWEYLVETYIDDNHTLMQRWIIDRIEYEYAIFIYRKINPILKLRYTEYFDKNGKLLKKEIEESDK